MAKVKRTVLDYVREHSSGKVKIAFADIDGILRGKYISTEKFLNVAEKGGSFCDVIFGWDSNDVTYDKTQYTGWHTGYPDAPARIDLSTFRKIPWEGDIPFFLASITDHEGKPAPIDPRQLLHSMVARCVKMGFTPYFAQEFEWFNYKESPQSAREKNFRNLQPLTPGMFGYSILRTTLENPYFTDLFELLKLFDIPLEGLHTETGPGVLEAAIRYDEALPAADKANLFKTAVKEIAYRHGILATFMAKVSEELPGSGGHVHQSLWDRRSTKNLFFEGNKKGTPQISTLMKQYIAGQLHCLPHILPMYAPTINSYKRLVEGAWAPTTLTWAFDNRTVALRVIGHDGKSCRLETRVIGADANPYLAMAACLASGLYGIENKLALKQPATVGNGYKEEKYGRLPATLGEAAGAMRKSPLARELFGEAFVEHFVTTREWEWRQHLKPVTDWEHRRYFEII